MDKRFSSLAADPDFIVSAVLEPHFQLRWARSTDEEQTASDDIVQSSTT